MEYYLENQSEHNMLLKIKLWMRLTMKPVQINGRLNSRADSWKIHNYKEQVQKGNSQKILESGIKKLRGKPDSKRKKCPTVSNRPESLNSIIAQKYPLDLVKRKRAVILVRDISLEIIHITEG